MDAGIKQRQGLDWTGRLSWEQGRTAWCVLCVVESHACYGRRNCFVVVFWFTPREGICDNTALAQQNKYMLE